MKNIVKTFQFYCVNSFSDQIKFLILILFAVFSHIVEILTLGLIALYFVELTGNLDNSYLEIIVNKFNLDLTDIKIFTFFLFGIVISKFLIQIFLNIYKYQLITNKYEIFQKKLIRIFLNSNYLSYKNFSSEQISKYINYDVERVYFNFVTNIINLIIEIIFFILILVTIGLNYSDYIDKVVIFFLIIFVSSIFILKKISLYLGTKQIKLLSKLFSTVKNIFGSYVEIKISNIENRVAENFNFNLNKYTKYFKIFAIYTTSIKYVLEFLIISIVLIFVFYFHNYSDLKFALSFDFALIGLFIIRTYPNFTRIQSFSAAFLHLLPIAKEIFNKISELEENKEIKILPTDKILVDEKSDLKITLNNLDFTYNNKKILENINLKIIKNEKICLYGEIGTGKTTILNLLLGLLKPSKGDYYINSKKITNSEQLKELFSYVPQNPYFFNDTIYNNLVFFQDNPPKKEQLLDILNKYDFFKFFNSTDIENYIIGENGSNLSGGQKQVIALMRAIIKNNPILILDEPTSSMDENTSKQFINIIENLNEKTIILVTHNESLINKFKTKYKLSDKKLSLTN